MNPTISIIVPVYNQEQYLSRCLDSILEQTFTDFEVLCIDDRSTDSSYKIIESYAKKDSRIIPLKNPKKGVSTARNYGLDNANGDYIGFVDSDDFIQPQMYEFLYKAIIDNKCDMSVCGYERVKDIKKKSFEYSCRECTCDEFISFEDSNFVLDNEMKVSSACMKLINKEIIKNLRFENYALGEDTVFCSNLWVNSNKVFYIDIPLYCYLINRDSVTHIPFNDKKWLDIIKTRFIAYKKYLQYPNEEIAYFYFVRGMYQINFYRFISKGTETEKFFKKETRKFFKKYIKTYINCCYESKEGKLKYLVFYYCPILYKYYRKHFYGDESYLRR